MIPRALKISIAVLLLAALGMGAYLYVLKGKEEERAERRADTQPMSAPVAGPSRHVALYIADDDLGTLRRKDINLALPNDSAERAREILHSLMGEYARRPSPHQLAPGADVKDVFLVNDTAVVDTTPAFADGHPSGILMESLTLASLVQTLAANVPSIKRVKFLVDGQERETLAGHADLTTFYDVAAMDQLARQLE